MLIVHQPSFVIDSVTSVWMCAQQTLVVSMLSVFQRTKDQNVLVHQELNLILYLRLDVAQ